MSDTYEPGSTFKILTTAAALEKGVVKMTDRFHCPGYKIVEDRRIRCHKKGGHGSETFLDGIMNSCNPVFIEVGARVGVSDFFRKMSDFGLMNRTGIDVPGEASTIIHKEKNVGAVELATMSFGQSFQLSPIRLVSLAGSMINGGYSITPHFGVSAVSADGGLMKHFSYGKKERVVSKETSDLIRMALGKVVSEGTGHKASVKGFSVGAKPEQVRNFRAAMENILRQPLVLLRSRIQKLLHLCGLMNRRAYTMEVLWQHRQLLRCLKTFSLIYAKTDLLNKCLR